MPNEAVPVDLWLDRGVPVIAGTEQGRPPFQALDLRIVDVRWTGLKQAYRDRWILRQPGRQNASRRTATDDDVVVLSEGVHPSILVEIASGAGTQRAGIRRRRQWRTGELAAARRRSRALAACAR